MGKLQWSRLRILQFNTGFKQSYSCICWQLWHFTSNYQMNHVRIRNKKMPSITVTFFSYKGNLDFCTCKGISNICWNILVVLLILRLTVSVFKWVQMLNTLFNSNCLRLATPHCNNLHVSPVIRARVIFLKTAIEEI